jgi:predicted CopG family antitoxin
VDKQPVFLAAIDWCSVNSSLILKSVTSGMSVKTLRHITVDEQNYLTLKRLGNAGDSFNDVISRLLKKSTMRKTEEEGGTSE